MIVNLFSKVVDSSIDVKVVAMCEMALLVCSCKHRKTRIGIVANCKIFLDITSSEHLLFRVKEEELT